MDKLILQEIELTYKISEPVIANSLITPMAIYELLLSQWNKKTINLLEESKVIYLNRANQLLGICSHSKGGISGTYIDNRLIIATALKSVASGIILAHNHPSGKLKPSYQDEVLTKNLINCCKIFEIDMIDHIIVTAKGYFSFRENGKL